MNNEIRHATNRIPDISFFDGAAFSLGRVHEICGPSRRMMAVRLAARMQGLVLWIRPKWAIEELLPAGVIKIMDPARLVYLNAPREEDILWSMEETLRSGAIPTVIAQIATPPALTPIRRLQMAAETGTKHGHKPPLILLLTPGKGGAQGVETRWHAAPILEDNGKKWRLTRSRARLAPLAEWHIGPSDFINPPERQLHLPAASD